MKNVLLIRQAIKFILVGGLNTLIDLGVLNLLIFMTGIASGSGYSVFKGISFIAAVVNSYFLNKFWTFSASARGYGGQEKLKEFSQFFFVSLIGFGINVGAASLVVNVIGNPFLLSGISDKLWANAGAIIATFCGMTWNFIGYKFIVFKK
ncbi:MAG: GtrA family protein [bacterium]